MEVIFQLVAALKEKAGRSEWVLRTGRQQVSVYAALREMETAFRKENLVILEGDDIRKDILVFKTVKNGNQQRVFCPKDTQCKAGEIIMLASAMGGG